jgi:hypothetical protein
MRFRPRHYVLIAVILALGVYNLVRSRRVRQEQTIKLYAPAPSGPVPRSSAWNTFDNAANLRDAPDAQFQPALHELHQQIDSASSQQKPDLDGCQTWLLFYRQNAHAAATDTWKQRSAQHLNTCISLHRDVNR